jgi:hypothetical protein
MDGANPILMSAITPMQCRAIAVEAHRRARDAVKKQYQGKGLKLRLISKRDIDIAAKDYLREHRELKTEIEGLRERNHWLDQQVTTLREQRDAALVGN